MAETKTKKTTKTKKAAPVAEKPVAEEKPAEKTFSKAEVDALVSEAIAKALEGVKTDGESASPAPVIHIQKEETVTLMFAGTMATGCVLSLGELGAIHRSYGTVDVPKSVFLQKRTYLIDKLLDKRVLVVLNGLTAEEKERFGLVYKDGELLTATEFYKILDFSADELAKLFTHLCEEHARIVARTFIDAYENGDARVTQEKVKKLNALSKKIDKDGLLTPVLEDMGRKLTEE